MNGSDVLTLMALVVSAGSVLVTLHYKRSAERRDQEREGRELVAEKRAEAAQTLAFEANERAKRAELRAEEAHDLYKKRSEVEAETQKAALRAEAVISSWIDRLEEEIDRHWNAEPPADKPYAVPGDLVEIEFSIANDAERMAANELHRRQDQLRLELVRIRGDTVTVCASLRKYLEFDKRSGVL